MDEARGSHLIARLTRFVAALYRAVPLEGGGLVGQAAELAHAAALDAEVAAWDAGDASAAMTALTPRDIRVACQLLIDVRRQPNSLLPAEVALTREHFPEVEAQQLDPLERLITFYTGLFDGAETTDGD